MGTELTGTEIILCYYCIVGGLKIWLVYEYVDPASVGRVRALICHVPVA